MFRRQVRGLQHELQLVGIWLLGWTAGGRPSRLEGDQLESEISEASCAKYSGESQRQRLHGGALPLRGRPPCSMKGKIEVTKARIMSPADSES